MIFPMLGARKWNVKKLSRLARFKNPFPAQIVMVGWYIVDGRPLRLYKWDLHVHSHGFDKPYAFAEEIIESAKRRGLDGLLILDKYFTCERNFCKNNDPEELDRYRERLLELAGDDITVVFGHEVITEQGELIVVGHRPDRTVTLDELLEDAKSSGAAVVVPHPGLPMSGTGSGFLAEKAGMYHGVEVFNAAVPLPMEFLLGINKNSLEFCSRYPGLSKTCGTDNNHGEVGIGYCLTEREIFSEEEFIEALKQGAFIPGTTFLTHGLGLLRGLYHHTVGKALLAQHLSPSYAWISAWTRTGYMRR
jgi:hypothetical protein